MLYRPNFCCNCGEKIERVEWNLLTSRRFCIVCSTENRVHDVLPRAVIAAGALALMFGFGSLWTGSARIEPVPTESTVGVRSSVPPAAPVQKVDRVNEPRIEASSLPGAQTSEPTFGAATDNGDQRHFCGALTKKGTPCSRKVKGKGVRCFQHEGRPEASGTD